jgi:hypothetical protein
LETDAFKLSHTAKYHTFLLRGCLTTISGLYCGRRY